MTEAGSSAELAVSVQRRTGGSRGLCQAFEATRGISYNQKNEHNSEVSLSGNWHSKMGFQFPLCKPFNMYYSVIKQLFCANFSSKS